MGGWGLSERRRAVPWSLASLPRKPELSCSSPDTLPGEGLFKTILVQAAHPCFSLLPPPPCSKIPGVVDFNLRMLLPAGVAASQVFHEEILTGSFARRGRGEGGETPNGTLQI